MTIHEYERGYRNPLTGEGPSDPHRALKLAIVLVVLALAVLYPIFCTAQQLPPGAHRSGTNLRSPEGSSVTGKQPPVVPTTRPASFKEMR